MNVRDSDFIEKCAELSASGQISEKAADYFCQISKLVQMYGWEKVQAAIKDVEGKITIDKIIRGVENDLHE